MTSELRSRGAAGFPPAAPGLDRRSLVGSELRPPEPKWGKYTHSFTRHHHRRRKEPQWTMIPYARSCATALTPRPPSTTNLRKANIALAKDDAQQAYDLFTHMSTDHLQLLLQAHRLDAHAMTRPASIIFSAGRQALIRAVLKTREQQRPDRDDRDDGLRFSATVRTPAEILHLEAANRLDLLAWLDVHADPEDVVTVTMEATGAAVPGTIAALRFGARRMR